MINEAVIKEIYKKYKKPTEPSKLNLPHIQKVLEKHNPIEIDEEMIILKKMDDFSPFKRFLIRRINTILEIDKMVAFVFPSHIIFVSEEDDNIHIHLRPEKEPGFFGRLFGRK